MSFGHEEFQLLDSLQQYRPKTRFDLASSGIEPADLDEFEIETNPRNLSIYRSVNLEESLGKIYGIGSSEVLICGGATMSIFLAIASLVRSGDEVVIPMPNYPPEYSVPRILGARVVPVQMKYEEKFRLDIQKISDAISRSTRMVVLTDSNNPTGLKIERRDLEEICEIAGKKDALVFVDDTFREFAQDPSPVARTLGDHVISAGSFTKYFGLGDLRVGWLFAEKKIMEKIVSLNKWVSVEISRLSYVIAAQAIEKKHLFDKRTRKITRENLAFGRDFIRENSNKLEWIEPDGAPYGFPKIRLSLSSLDLFKTLIEKYGILLNPGEFFEYPGHVRLCLTRSPEKTKASLEVLSTALSEIQSQ